ncbi:Alpha-ketoglutaric semialdehyde dehydrogenase [Microbacterium sp. Bi98]|uniref:aldehyde dehydrogenase (NADP(+)) n=1 Tax=unclassified Microbacterium TaxID=2609290 RepID=UPI000700C416|nr:MULTISPECIES: aldehyde dehydrogenase (NADP(+)) [unclassified Microbacterium]KRD53962.1 2,5-dioxovalerate dehydrogenase [Microbacterium sp. Root280D1]CAH0255738.1 Alpha-ketoglutaric semialdehyde dehydrogenase [Microbacterium sp. Bi98]
MTVPVLTGHSSIAGRSVAGTGSALHAIAPDTDEQLDPPYSQIDVDQLREATAAAAEAFVTFSRLEPEAHAAFLETVAEEIEAIGDTLIERAMQETGLPQARLLGERARTTGQLRLFAEVVRAGEHRGVRIDPAQPDRTPVPRVDIRQRKIPLGPVAVFGASNFPFAFSTAGGDTASALAAGCPVVFKAHSSHPGTSELVAAAIARAIDAHGLHPGVFSHIFGPGRSVGQALVSDPEIQAVGFTGSREGGLALVRASQARPVPIPVYAEMSSVNPVFILPGALRGDVGALAAGYVQSATGSSGQLCTQPGIVFVPRGEQGDAFLQAVSEALRAATGQTMLSPSIAAAWLEGVETRDANAEILARGSDGEGPHAPAPVIHAADLGSFEENHVLHEEIFGAASLVVRYGDVAELVQAASRLEGQLTATLQLSADDNELAAALLPVLERKVGRILANGWPTGVEVGHAMVHGGPFPATSDSRTTSVGTLAIERFLRPVAYQNIPDELLPEALRDANPWHVPRFIDGRREASA